MDTRLDSTPTTTADQIADHLYASGARDPDGRPGFLREMVRGYWDLGEALDINPEWAVAQFALETGHRTNGHPPGVSAIWLARGMPAGMGVTDGPDYGYGFATGAKAAQGQMTHLYLYRYGTTLPEGYAWLKDTDPRWDAVLEKGWEGTVRTADDLTGKWATDPNYGAGLKARYRTYIEGAPASDTPPVGGNEGGPDMAGYQMVQFVGLSQPVAIPADITVHIDIVPDRFIGWVRSGQRFTGQVKTTFHDTGAPGQNARSQRNYLHNGPSEGGQRRQVGFNFAVDDKEIIQLTPLDEVTWAAGTPEGNRTSWHVEQCFGPGIDWDRSLRNAIALHAGLIAAKGWSTDTALVPHKHWYGKWCPAQVLNRGLWPSVVSRVDIAAKAIAGGVTAATISAKDIVATTVRLNLRESATTGASILTTLEASTELEVLTGPTEADGYAWWKVTHGDATGFVAEAGSDGPYLVVTQDYVEPDAPEEPEEPGWTYPAPLAIAELAPYVGQPIVPMPATIALSNGHVAIPMFDRARAVRDTRRMRDFDGAEDVGPLLSAELEFDVSLLEIDTSTGAAVFVTPYWTRIRAEDVEIVSDIPRDIPAAEPEAA